MNEPRVGVAALIWKAGQVLLIKRQNVRGAGTWSTPGGHLEYSESLEDCARREAFDRVGIETPYPHQVMVAKTSPVKSAGAGPMVSDGLGSPTPRA